MARKRKGAEGSMKIHTPNSKELRLGLAETREPFAVVRLVDEPVGVEAAPVRVRIEVHEAPVAVYLDDRIGEVHPVRVPLLVNLLPLDVAEEGFAQAEVNAVLVGATLLFLDEDIGRVAILMDVDECRIQLLRGADRRRVAVQAGDDRDRLGAPELLEPRLDLLLCAEPDRLLVGGRRLRGRLGCSRCGGGVRKLLAESSNPREKSLLARGIGFEILVGSLEGGDGVRESRRRGGSGHFLILLIPTLRIYSPARVPFHFIDETSNKPTFP